MSSVRPQLAAPGVWRYPPALADAVARVDGYAIDATDGFIGTVGVARDEPAGAYLIALGGPWNGGRTLMIPAGAVRSVERDGRVVHLNCSRRQLDAAPAYENDRYQDAAYRFELGAYYERLASVSKLAAMTAALRAGVFSTPAAAGGRPLAG